MVTKNQIIKRNSRSLETLNAKLSLLNRIASLGLPEDIIEQEQAALQAMSTEDFQAVIRDNLNVDEMIWVVVGDGASQRDGVKEFAAGAFFELDRRGVVIN